MRDMLTFSFIIYTVFLFIFSVNVCVNLHSHGVVSFFL